MKHAPGPWRISGEFDAEVSVEILDAEGNVVWELEPQSPDAWDEPSVANARLTAAAPELLASINLLMDQLQLARDNQPEAFAEFVNEVCGPEFSGACIAVARAVAKAEGTDKQ